MSLQEWKRWPAMNAVTFTKLAKPAAEYLENPSDHLSVMKSCLGMVESEHAEEDFKRTVSAGFSKCTWSFVARP